MDDFRKRYDVPRRDYGIPAQRPPQTPPNPALSQPSPQHRAQPHHQPHPQPHQTQPAAIDQFTPPTHHQPHQQIHHRPVPVAEPAAASKLRRKPSLKLSVIVAGVVLFVLVAGWFALKPAKPKVVTAADLAKQASFGFFYPTPLPAGYSYETKQGTYQSGSAYYMIINGTKHIIIREEQSNNTSLNLGKLSDSTQFKTPVGNAIIGTNTGQTAAFVIADSTLITIHSNGSVPKEDMTALINNLKRY